MEPAASHQPGFLDLVRDGCSSFALVWSRCTPCGPGAAALSVAHNARFDLYDAGLFIGLAVAWTVARRFVTARFIQPFALWLELLPRDGAKFPESVWKLFFYTVAWIYTCYLLFNGNYNFFHDPQSVFHDWHSGMPVPLDIYAAYLLQGSFYLHSVYGTICMDTWRRDSPMMLLHHAVTVLLVSFSYAFRYHNVGIIVFFLHDITDILLEFSKINIYLKQHGGQYQHIYKLLADVSSAGFGVTWFLFRLYWFPLKVLYATSVSSLKSHPVIPFYFFFNILLLAITAMNLYWFSLIIMFVFKIMTGQLAEVADTREYDISTQTQQESLASHSKTQSNGDLKDKTL
uniref:ceramide synthase 1-like n=1 Tax=Myxine glutinosa TaxID=7769 RepID=UPI00358E3600